MRTAIELRDLRKSFGDTQVLDGVTIAVESGTIFALLGPNGAGKTTIINILSTLVKPDSGSASVEGNDVVHNPRRVRQSISLTGQSVAVDDVLSGEENLRMMSRLSGLSRAESKRRTTELLDSFDLASSARKPAKTYSGGMRRRLDLAISLITAPPVIFLDEPTTGLDTRSRHELWSVIGSLRESGTTILLTTQYLEEADNLADNIAVINGGRVVAQGPPSELKAAVGGDVVELRDEFDALVTEIPTDGTVHGLRLALDQLEGQAQASATRTSATQTRATRTSAVQTGSVRLRRPTLDDVFLALTASDGGSLDDSTPRATRRPAQKEYAS